MAATGHGDETADVLSPSRHDSYLKGNRAPEVCAFWTPTTGESLLTQLSEPAPPFFVFLFLHIHLWPSRIKGWWSLSS